MSSASMIWSMTCPALAWAAALMVSLIICPSSISKSRIVASRCCNFGKSVVEIGNRQPYKLAIHSLLIGVRRMTDLYSTLDIPASAAQAEIKRAYRKAAKRHHPDTPTGSQEAFHKLTRAYLVLSDPARREKYDRTGDIDEATVDNTLSQAVSIIVGSLMSAVDGYVKGATSDPSAEDMVDVVRSFVRKNVTNFENQKRQMEKAQASLKDIAKRWSAINPIKGNKKPIPGAKFLKQAIDQQAAGTEEPLRKINQQIETYKLALELLANSSFNPAPAGQAQKYQPMSRTWTSITTF
jgi:hypothetical protein